MKKSTKSFIRRSAATSATILVLNVAAMLPIGLMAGLVTGVVPFMVGSLMGAVVFGPIVTAMKDLSEKKEMDKYRAELYADGINSNNEPKMKMKKGCSLKNAFAGIKSKLSAKKEQKLVHNKKLSGPKA